MTSHVSNATSPYYVPVEFNSVHSAYIVLAVVIMFFNGGVLFVMWKNKTLQRAENSTLASLALSDLSTGMIGIPLAFSCTFTSIEVCTVCHSSYLFFKFISIATVLHILTVIGERYLLVLYPFLHRKILARSRRRVWVILSLWSVSLLAANIPWFWLKIDCQEANETSAWIIYDSVLMLMFFAVPLFMITIFLAKIFVAARLYVRRKTTQTDQFSDGQITNVRKTEMRIFLVLSGMFVIFLVCWLPFFVSVLWSHIHHPLPDWLRLPALFLRCITSLLNPVMYIFYKDDFYRALRKDLQKHLNCCSEKKHRETSSRMNPQPAMPLVALNNNEEA